MDLLKAVLDLIYPPRCIFCGKLLEKGAGEVCPACVSTLPVTEGKGTEQTGEFFEKCVSPLYYMGDVRESFCRYKFQGMEGYAEPYARWMADCVRDHVEGGFDLVTWVPLSRKHLRKRGYDQAKLLACRMAKEFGREAVPLLRKPRDVKTQSGLGGPEQRRANVLGAYEPLPGADMSAYRGYPVHGSIALTARGQQVLELLDVQGISESKIPVIANQ